MMRFSWMMLVGLAVLSLTAATQAEEHALARVPGDAAVVIRLKSPDKTIERVAALADAVQEGLGVQLRQFAEQAQAEPELNGVDVTRDWLLMAFAIPGGPLEVVLALPARDAQALAAAAQDPWMVVVHEDRVYGSQSAELLEKFAVRPAENFADLLDDESRRIFNEGDLALFINIDQLTAKYDDELAALTARIRQGIGQLGQLPAEATGGMDMAPIAGMYQGLLDHLVQGIRDAQSATLAVRVSCDGVVIDERLRLEEGTATFLRLAGQPTSDFKALSQLPPDQPFYVGFLGDMQQLTQWSLDWTRQSLKLDEQQQQAFNAIGETIQSIEYGEIAGTVGLGSTEGDGLVRATMIVAAAPTATVQALMRAYGETLGAITTSNLRQVTITRPEAETYGQRTADLITVTQEFTGPQAPVQQAILETLFGAAGMESRIVYLDDRYLQTTGGGREAMEVALKQLDTSRDNGLDAHRSALPSQGNFVLLADVASAIIRTLRFVVRRASVPIALDTDLLDEIKTEASYIGFAASSVPDGLHCRTHLPLEQLRMLFDIVTMFQSMQGR